MPTVALLVLIAVTALLGFSQSNPDLQTFSKRGITRGTWPGDGSVVLAIVWPG